MNLIEKDWICVWRCNDCKGWEFSWIEDKVGTTQMSGTCFLLHSFDNRGEYLKEVVRIYRSNQFTCCIWRRKK